MAARKKPSATDAPAAPPTAPPAYEPPIIGARRKPVPAETTGDGASPGTVGPSLPGLPRGEAPPRDVIIPISKLKIDMSDPLEVFGATRHNLTDACPFFNALLMQYDVVFGDKSLVDRAATDGAKIFLNAEWFLKIGWAERTGALCHEVLHCAMSHFVRKKRGSRNAKYWNIAGDIVINGIIDDFFGRGPGVMTPEQIEAEPENNAWKLPPHEIRLPENVVRRTDLKYFTVEEVYEILMREKAERDKIDEENKKNKPKPPKGQKGPKPPKGPGGDPPPPSDDDGEGDDGDDGEGGDDGDGDGDEEGEGPGGGPSRPSKKPGKPGKGKGQPSDEEGEGGEGDDEEGQPGSPKGKKPSKPKKGKGKGQQPSEEEDEDGDGEDGHEGHDHPPKKPGKGDKPYPVPKGADPKEYEGSHGKEPDCQQHPPGGDGPTTPGGDGPTTPGGDGPTTPGGEPGSEETDKQIVQRAVNEQIKKKGFGSFPGNMLDRINHLLSNSQVDWKTVLWRFITKSMYDFNGPYDNRFVHEGNYFETLEEDSVTVYVCIDTSGSISQEELGKFLSEIRDILRAYPNLKGIGWYCDTQLYGPYPLQDMLVQQSKGGGGTSFEPFFVEVNKLAAQDRSGVAIYFTDGYGSFPHDPPVIPTLWLVSAGGLALEAFPFGEAIRFIASQ